MRAHRWTATFVIVISAATCCDEEPSGRGSTSGTTGGAAPTSADACPGEPLSLSVGRKLEVLGTTVGANDDEQPFCVQGASGPDVVYALTLEEAGVLTVRVDPASGSALDPVMLLRDTCAADTANSYCVVVRDAPIQAHLDKGMRYLFVDGASAVAGEFKITATLSAPRCGDDVMSPGEQCDDGNDTAGDGCAACRFEPQPAAQDRCPGETVSLTPAGAVLEGNTTGYADDARGSCVPEQGGLDRVYRIVPSVAGTMRAAIGLEADGTTSTCDLDHHAPACWDRAIFVRTDCGAASSEVACSDVAWDTPERVELPVEAGKPYWLFVDGYDGGAYSYGPFRLSLSLTPAAG